MAPEPVQLEPVRVGWVRRGMRRGAVRATGTGGAADGDASLLDAPLHRWQLASRALILVGASAAMVALLAHADRSRSALRTAASASPAWLGLAILTTAGTYAAAALTTMGSTSIAVPYRSTVWAQLAAGFANRLAPGGLGGAAVTARYLERLGATRPQALAAVVAGAASVSMVHVVAFVALLPLVGTPDGFVIPDGTQVVLVAGAALVAVGVITWRTRLGRHLPRPLLESAVDVAAVFRVRRQRRLVLTGAGVVTMLHCLTLWAVLRSVGGAAGLGACTVVYLAAAAVGAVSPTPSGLGAIEAALVAGLHAATVPTGAAAGAVVVYHLLSFWLPVAPGAVGFIRLHQRRLV